jgi:DeoR/GlpR family transcriptional regulator of sugar metabolism
MMRRAARSVILADHSKFNSPSLAVYGVWSEKVSLISDAAPEGPLAEALSEARTEILVAPASPSQAARSFP